jgi:hypothetical protein
MSRPRLFIMLIIGLVLTAEILAFGITTSPQCVACFRQRGSDGSWNCWECVSAASGSTSCRTPKCESFTHTGSPYPSRPGFEEQRSSNLGEGKFKIDNDTIREIAQKHPRFAATLAQSNSEGWDSRSYETKWVVFPLSAGDVEYWLRPRTDREAQVFFKQVKEQARWIDDIVTYEVKVIETDTSKNLTLSVVGDLPANDPSYRTLHMTLVKRGIVWTSVSNQFSLE